jgi:DNA (cytosine-5)-methyltransferase 1
MGGVERADLGYKIGSLFSGIGLLDYGVECAGLGQVIWQCEIEPFCRSVLAGRFPGCKLHSDVREINATNVEPIDIIIGGFPCQDLSVSGKGLGLAGSRSGLWFEYLRLIQELSPVGVIIENVTGLIRRGLDTVIQGLYDAGYKVEASIISADMLSAPHARDRLFIVAWNASLVHALADRERSDGRGVCQKNRTRDKNPISFRGPNRKPEPGLGGAPYGCTNILDSTRWPARPLEIPHSWEPPRSSAQDKISKMRRAALGNAVVPQCAFVAAKRLLQQLEGSYCE